MSESTVQVLNILGQPYTIRAPEHEQQTLKRAELLLQQRLAESQQRYPNARSLELLALTALNLCVPLCQQQERDEQMQDRLQAIAGLITTQLRND